MGAKEAVCGGCQPPIWPRPVVEPSFGVLDDFAGDGLLATGEQSLYLSASQSRVGGLCGSLSALAFVVSARMAVLSSVAHVVGDVFVVGSDFGVVDHESVGIDGVEADVLSAWVYAEGVLPEFGVVSLLGETDGEWLVTYGYRLSLAEESACPGGAVHGLQRCAVCVENVDDGRLLLLGFHACVPPFSFCFRSCFSPVWGPVFLVVGPALVFRCVALASGCSLHCPGLG